MNARVCAIMVTYNRLETLKTAVAHILAQTVQPAAIVIVDNHSTDGTTEYLQSLHENEIIRCIFMSSNEGPAGGISKGMSYGLKLGEFDYCWILDDDTFYEKNALSELLATMRTASFTMLGLHGAHIKMGRKIPVNPDIRLQEADYVMIDGAIIKAEAIKTVGPVSEKFFMMCEDHEYCIRLKKHGYTIGVLKNDTDQRLYLGSGKFTKSTMWRGYYSARNHILILKQYFSFVNLLGYIVLQLKLLIAAAVLAPDRFQRVKLRLLGIWHGIRGKHGKTLDPATLKFKQKNK